LAPGRASLSYESVFFPRENNKAPVDFQEKSGNTIGKAPALKDGDLVISESGAITEYLVETYDTNQDLLGGTSIPLRNRIRTFIHAAEGTFMVHALSITYARWFAPEANKSSGDLKKLEEGCAVNVGKDLDWLEKELEGRRFIAGEKISAADTMCLFSVQFIFARDLVAGKKVEEWPNVKGWVERCEETSSWKKAVEKTGHKM